jgi:hypothetical protein
LLLVAISTTPCSDGRLGARSPGPRSRWFVLVCLVDLVDLVVLVLVLVVVVDLVLVLVDLVLELVVGVGVSVVVVLLVGLGRFVALVVLVVGLPVGAATTQGLGALCQPVADPLEATGRCRDGGAAADVDDLRALVPCVTKPTADFLTSSLANAVPTIKASRSFLNRPNR